MAASNINTLRQDLRTTQGREGTALMDRERFRIRAKELQRQRLVLETELSSTGISEGERDYLNQRIQTISNDEDAIGQKLATAERTADAARRAADEAARNLGATEAARQRLLTQRGRQQLTNAAAPNPPAQQYARFEKAVRLYQRRQREREETYARLKGEAKKALFIIAGAALAVAAVADILSIVDLGWVVSWLLPMITWFIVRRINGIERSIAPIAQAQVAARGELRLLYTRLQPQLIASGQTRLYASALTLEVRQKVRSYVMTFIRDEILVQIWELIPVLDWLPTYLGLVVKMLRDQSAAYRRAQAALVPYRQTLDMLTRLEQFELAAAAQQLGVQQAPQAQAQAPAPVRTRSVTQTELSYQPA